MHYQKDEWDYGYYTIDLGETKVTKKGLRPFATVTRAQISENITGPYHKNQNEKAKCLPYIQQMRHTSLLTALQLSALFPTFQDQKENLDGFFI